MAYAQWKGTVSVEGEEEVVVLESVVVEEEVGWEGEMNAEAVEET